MPYIKPERRDVVDSFEGQYGDLVYYYYRILLECWKAAPSFSRYFQMRYLLKKETEKVDGDIVSALLVRDGKDYTYTGGLKVPQSLRNVAFACVYAYECAVDELKRRHVDKYEDAKMKENGDVL